MTASPYALLRAHVTAKREDTPGIYTLGMRLTDAASAAAFRFAGGQFNMLYVFGVGEIPISIVSDPDEPQRLDHTIRVVGRVSEALAGLKVGDELGIRGPYGQGWPLEEAQGKDVLVITGGLGCAPVVGAIEYMFRRREQYGAIKILHGVKTPRDLLYRERFDAWRRHANTEVLLASDQPGKTWHYHIGVVTELFDAVEIDAGNTVVMMCGPEVMMRLAAQHLRRRGVDGAAMYLSMERNMQCGMGLCGHCQIGPYFVCRDGPVMRLDRIAPFLGREG